MKLKIALAMLIATMAGFASAHGGGLDAAGCHMDHKTGTYHCH